MRRFLPFLLFWAAACGPGENEQQRLVAEAREHFTPPADGKVTEKQLIAYVAASRRARGSDADSGASELDAARRSGMNGEEYLWVRQEVLDAILEIEQADARRRNVETYRRSIEALRKVLAASTDPATREVVARQIADLQREAADSERAARQAPAGVEAANEAVVRKHWSEVAPAARRGT
jgi:hypothetical protein